MTTNTPTTAGDETARDGCASPQLHEAREAVIAAFDRWGSTGDDAPYSEVHTRWQEALRKLDHFAYLAALPSVPVGEAVAWRYRVSGSQGRWTYTDAEGPFPGVLEVEALYAPPAPLPSADVEAAIQDYGNRLLVFQSLGGIGNARALDDARAALLALYRAPVQSPSREVEAAVTDLVNGIEDAANACHDATVWRDEGTWDAHIQPHIARLLAPFRAPVQTSGETEEGVDFAHLWVDDVDPCTLDDAQLALWTKMHRKYYPQNYPATSPEGADHNG